AQQISLLAYRFVAAVAGYPTKGFIDVENDPGWIGDHNPFGSVCEDTGGELQPGFGAFAGRDVFREDDDAAKGPGACEPWPCFPAQKLHAAVGAFKAILVAFDGFAAESAAMDHDPARRKIGEYFVVRSPQNVGSAKTEVFVPSPAGGKVPHMAIEHGERGGSMLNKELKQLLALTQIRLRSLPVGDVLDGAAHEHRFAGFIPL